MKTVLALLAVILSLAPAAAQKKIPMQASAWELNGNAAEFISHLGTPSLLLDEGTADATGDNIVTVNDLVFANGTIEYDVAMAANTRFTSIHFRRKDGANSEHFYLRANAVGDPNVNSAVQYAAILKGVNLWDLSNEYQSNATLKADGWNHVKLIVRDGQLLAYVNDMSSPALYVPIMDGDWASGSIGFDGNVYLANLTVTPDVTPGLSPGRGIDLVYNDARYLRNWEVGEPSALPAGSEPTVLPDESAGWSAITAERFGMVNLSRRFGATPRGSRRIVWLKTTLTTKKATQRQLDFGFSDEVYVYLNGKPLYVDKNLFNTPGMKAPRGRCSIENARIDLPLQEGENELLVGVTNFFFGWGVVARLNDGAGLIY
ncbi:hypothetical protein FUA23_03700 [Neolewinella aurantiaca]|uniref:3-keto-disaccharide hydrolase domain-containing protein n=1 Tax=Neolewinella aurantiaca TaxID=2602767 RepID=A0A5C7FJT6_9BACT|nr:hypothetical protein [Neolewinella aurantiaca]TXF90914.1 hypothetical protein FUA23_03700 [Neolewinella aurantiaca]